MAGVDGSFRQTTDGLHHFFASQSGRRFDSFPANQFRERRGASHGRNASFGEKSDFCDVAVRDLQA